MATKLAALAQLLASAGFSELSFSDQEALFKSKIQANAPSGTFDHPKDEPEVRAQLIDIYLSQKKGLSPVITDYLFALQIEGVLRQAPTLKLLRGGIPIQWQASGQDTICVMADFGFSPYAWRRPADKPPPFVGTCVADADDGFNLDVPIPEGLTRDFAEWERSFEAGYDQEDFDWKAWNDTGIELTLRLKGVVGELYNIEYHYPYEDPREEFHNVVLVIE